MSDNLLSIENLSIAFQIGEQQVEVVKRISFSLKKGKTLALVGESGSGKSVTAHAILKLLPYPAASHPNGQIVYQNTDLLALNDAEMRSIRGNKIGMIFQEPMTALNPLHRIEKQIGEVLQQHQQYDKEALKDKALELLKQVKMPNAEVKLKAYPHELSGGQRQRVMIAMALANEPEILIADEPTTALDVTVQRDILDLLKSLQSERQLSLLLITHDLGVVQYMSDDVVVMKDGAIIESQSASALFHSPQHDFTREMIDSVPSGHPRPIKANGIPNALLKADCLSVNYVLKKSIFGKTIAQLPAVKKACLNIQKGETLGIVGESGSGKSTLAMALLRLIQSEGSIHFRDREISSEPERALRSLRSQLQVVFQDPFASLSPRMTIGDIIGEGLAIHSPLSKKERIEKVIAVMSEVGLDPASRHRFPHEFSGGQRQRVAIARALILDPALIVLDEPTSALDRAVQAQVIDLLRRLQEKHDLSYLFISHDLKVVRAISHRVMVMKDGEIVESGNAEDILQTPKNNYTRKLLAASF